MRQLMTENDNQKSIEVLKKSNYAKLLNPEEFNRINKIHLTRIGWYKQSSCLQMEFLPQLKFRNRYPRTYPLLSPTLMKDGSLRAGSHRINNYMR